MTRKGATDKAGRLRRAFPQNVQIETTMRSVEPIRRDHWRTRATAKCAERMREAKRGTYKEDPLAYGASTESAEQSCDLNGETDKEGMSAKIVRYLCFACLFQRSGETSDYQCRHKHTFYAQRRDACNAVFHGFRKQEAPQPKLSGNGCGAAGQPLYTLATIRPTASAITDTAIHIQTVIFSAWKFDPFISNEKSPSCA